MAGKSRLGKGLGALIPQTEKEKSTATIDINLIEANPFQPRRHFDEASIEELARSMEQHGLLQPILIRKKADDKYQLVSGERRLRAAKLANIHQLPAIVKQVSDSEMMEIALIENLQRQDLNPLEEARAYQTLIDEFGFTQEKIAKKIGKSRSNIANYLRLLKLSPQVREYVSRETLSMGHARALLGAEEFEKQNAIAARVITSGLSVRETEELVKNWGKKIVRSSSLNRTPELKEWEQSLMTVLGSVVRIKPQSRESGAVEIRYKSLDELKNLTIKLKSDY